MSKAKELQELGQWKVGQQVYIEGSSLRCIKTISRITDGRDGTIYVNDKGGIGAYSFDIHGWERGGNEWRRVHIVPATEEHKKMLKAMWARTRLQAIKWSELSDDKALEIQAMMINAGLIVIP